MNIPYAFPHQELCGDGAHHATHGGMTLRDYFAAKALVGLIGKYGLEDTEDLSVAAYNVANAMMAEREKS